MRTHRFKGNVIIWNLPQDFTAAALASLFDDFGLVLGATVKRWEEEPDRSPRGLVDLAPERAVDRAIECLDGSTIGFRRVKVRRFHDVMKPASAHRSVATAPRPEPAGFVDKATARKRPIVEYRSLPRRHASTGS